MTSSVCPSQWNAKTNDGRKVYIRFRWGYLSVRVETDSYPGDAVKGEEIFGKQLSDSLDGFLSEEQLCDILLKQDLLSD